MVIKNIPQKLIYFQIFYNCFIKFLITDFHLPSALNYVTDLITLALVYIIFTQHSSKITLGNNATIVFAGILLLIGTLSAIMSPNSSTPLYLWSFRNNFRLFVFFYCCCKILTPQDVKNLLEALLYFLYANIIVCMFEYFVKHIDYDFLGGLYGNGIRGGNGPLNSLLIVTIAYLIIEYINKNKSVWHLLFGVSGSLFVATVAELKFFYFEIMLLIVLICVFVTKNFRMAVFVSIITIVGIIGLYFYIKLYPNRANFFTVGFVKQYSLKETYGTSSKMNRLNAISYINTYYFNGNLKKFLFGLGMGNGEMSSQFSFLTSSFYNKYGRILRYDWFSQSFLFVEFGIVGLIVYTCSIISSGLKSFKSREENSYMQTAFISAIFIVLTIFYNQSLRIESFCYTAAFLIAIPYIHQRSLNDTTDIKHSYSSI